MICDTIRVTDGSPAHRREHGAQPLPYDDGLLHPHFDRILQPSAAPPAPPQHQRPSPLDAALLPTSPSSLPPSSSSAYIRTRSSTHYLNEQDIRRDRHHRDSSDDDDDIIAGGAFISLLLGSRNQRRYEMMVNQERDSEISSSSSSSSSTTSTTTSTTSSPPKNVVGSVAVGSTTEHEDPPAVVRETRSSPEYYYPQRSGRTYITHAHNSYRRSTPTSPTTITTSTEDGTTQKGDGMIIAVRVSSSVGRGFINKRVSEPMMIPRTAELTTTTTTTTPDATTTTSEETTTVISTTTYIEQDEIQPEALPLTAYDQLALQSEELPTIVAEANKSEFSIDERDPITHEQNYSDGYFKPDDSKKLPFHRSVVYHDTEPVEQQPTRARSVSYSTVIQALPQQRKPWQRRNKPELVKDDTNLKEEPAVPHSDSAAESKDYYVTSKYEHNPKPSWQEVYNHNRALTSSTVQQQHVEPTERNWGIPEKNYGVPEEPNRQLPIVYGQPEQNYEVDETVSVETNGRAHGVQPQSPHQHHPATRIPQRVAQTQPPTRPKDGNDDNQKVGYVVEGRNFRKYRVEERTSDGFIVGEYGVVSHNDGSLRGVRYTADGTINPRLIYDALMKFLAL